MKNSSHPYTVDYLSCLKAQVVSIVVCQLQLSTLKSEALVGICLHVPCEDHVLSVHMPI